MNSVRVPDASQNIQRAFVELEKRSRALEARVKKLESVDITGELDDLRRQIINVAKRPAWRTWEQVFGSYNLLRLVLAGPFGSFLKFTFTNEEVTLSTVGLNTDSVTNLLPANSIIFGTGTFITQTISGGGVTSVMLGDATTTNRFQQNLGGLTAGTVNIGTRQWDTSQNVATVGPRQNNAALARLTAVGGTPTQGKVRIIVASGTIFAPTS